MEEIDAGAAPAGAVVRATRRRAPSAWMDRSRAREHRQADGSSGAKLIQKLAGRGCRFEGDSDNLLLAPFISEGDGAGDTCCDLCRSRRTWVVGRILGGIVAQAVGRACRAHISRLTAGWTCGPGDDRPACRKGAF